MTDLRDCRTKLTVEADAALDAEARATGKDRSEIVRDVMHQWAILKIEMAKLLLRRLDAEGLGGTHEGTTGSTRP